MTFHSVSIVGAGPLGCELAITCAAAGVPVVLVRATGTGSAAAHGQVTLRLGARLESRLADGSITEQARAAIEAGIELSAELTHASSSDLVVDATAFEPRARRALLATLESKLSVGAVPASVAASEQLVKIAEVLRRPDQFVGMRFMPSSSPRSALVELTVLPDTAPGVIAACHGFVGWLGNTALERASQPPRIGYREWLSSTAA